MDAIDSYIRARDLMTRKHVPVPNRILREYLDTMRIVRRYASGLHQRVIIVSRDTSAESIKRFTAGLKLSDSSPENVTIESRNSSCRI